VVVILILIWSHAWHGMGWDGMEWNVVESGVCVQEKAVFTWNARGNFTDRNNARGTCAASKQRGKVQLGRTSSPCFRDIFDVLGHVAGLDSRRSWFVLC
jgi:hypothetical protein